MPNTLPVEHVNLAAQWRFQTYLPLYAKVVFAAVLCSRHGDLFLRVSGSPAVLLLFGLLFVQLTCPLMSDRNFYTVFGIGLIIAAMSRNILSRLLFENPVAIWLGNISFSIYLVHLPLNALFHSLYPAPYVHRAFHWVLFLVLLFLVCSVTYLFIERPFLSGRIASRRARAAS